MKVLIIIGLVVAAFAAGVVFSAKVKAFFGKEEQQAKDAIKKKLG